MRKSSVLVHRWLGIIAGLYVGLIALSGIGMVFSTTFYEWEFGEQNVSVQMQDRPYAPPHVWLEKAEARYGKLPGFEGYFGPRATPMRISAPTLIYEPPGRHHVHGVITVNPYTGEPLVRFVAEDTWSMLPLKLHMSLFLPETIWPWVLVTLSLILILFGLSGLYIWWPGRARWRIAAQVVKPSSPINLRRLHGAIGFWTSPLIILAGVTGLMLTRFDVAEAITAPLGASAEYDPATNPPGLCTAPRNVTAGDSLALARQRFPGHELASLTVPTTDAPVFTIWMRPAASTVPARGSSEIVVDARCGNILFARGQNEMRSGDTVLTYLIELHNGRLLGFFGEALIVVQGIALTLLPLAGITLWLWRRKRRRKPLYTPPLIKDAQPISANVKTILPIETLP
jgi:uncharacterized iron-regulated membrane protein